MSFCMWLYFVCVFILILWLVLWEVGVFNLYWVFCIKCLKCLINASKLFIVNSQEWIWLLPIYRYQLNDSVEHHFSVRRFNINTCIHILKFDDDLHRSLIENFNGIGIFSTIQGFVMSVTHGDLNEMADILQTTFSNAFSWKKIMYLIQISLKFDPLGPIDKKSTLVEVMAWCWTGG